MTVRGNKLGLDADAQRRRQKIVLWLVRSRGYALKFAERAYDQATARQRSEWELQMGAAAGEPR